MISTPQHEISVIVDGVQIREWLTYDITTSMTTPADMFSMSIAFDRRVWDLCRRDRPIKVLIDEVTILTGFIGGRDLSEDGETIEIHGRDRAGRLVDESAPTLSFAGQTMKDLIERVAEPWFTKVVFSNARNRRITRGRGKKARASDDPVALFARKKAAARIEPGQTRWQVIQTLCEQAGALAWSSCDGSELIIGQPNYDQEPQYRFFAPASGSARTDEATVLGLAVSESSEDSYSRIIVVGSGAGTAVNYGAAAAARLGEVRDNPATVDGEGLVFSAPKRLIVVRSVSSIAEARELAKQEKARRDARSQTLRARCAGHGQVIAGLEPTVFVPDTIASVEDERTGIVGRFMVTSCQYRSARDGEETIMTIVPSRTELSQV